MTPITTSSDQGSSAPVPSSGNGNGRINMLRRRVSARSTPVTPVVYTLNVEPSALGKAKAKAKVKAKAKSKSPMVRTASPKRALEEYKPTVAIDSGGFVIFYDPRVPSKWRNMITGRFARAPPDHQPGGCFYHLLAPPEYDPNTQLKELWAECALGDVPEATIALSEPVRIPPSSADAAPATARRPSSRRPPTTPRQGRSLERREVGSPGTNSPKVPQQRATASSEPPPGWMPPRDYRAWKSPMQHRPRRLNALGRLVATKKLRKSMDCSPERIKFKLTNFMRDPKR